MKKYRLSHVVILFLDDPDSESKQGARTVRTVSRQNP